MPYINMKDEWKLFFGWVVIVSLLLLSECAPAPNTTNKHITHELIEPLGTKHKYRKKPIVDKSYYCLIHEYPEIIYEVDGVLRVKRWSGYDWRN